MSASQIQGFTTANVMEVEANTRAARVTLRPEDYGTLGYYSVAQSSGLMAAGLGAAAPIFSARWGDATRFALIKKVLLSASNDATAFTAGSCIFNLFVARSFSASDTSGTAMLPASNQNKLRTTGMGTTLFTDIRLSSTATLTAGTRTLDANPLSTYVSGIVATAGSLIFAPYPIFDQRPGEHPLLLAQNEGIVLQATVPATGTWKFGIQMVWLELTSY